MSSTAISAKHVQELRQRTGAGMMDCKRALEDTSGDMDKAIELLRMKGIAKAEKRAGRAASEGQIASLISEDTGTGSLVEVNCETDFVGRNEDFVALVADLARQVISDQSLNEVVHDAAQGAIMTQKSVANPEQTVEQVVKAAAARTGENVMIRRYARFQSDGTVGSYVHHNGRVATLVEIGGGRGEEARQLAATVAEHIAAGVPVPAAGVTRDEVPAELIEKERRIFEEQARASGKPDNIVQKMIEGRIAKLYKEVALLDQPWIRDDKQSINEVVTEMSRKAGSQLSVRRFVRFQMGE